MADRQNPGQFGNREDTVEQARKGGQTQQKSTQSDSTSSQAGQFGTKEGADPQKAGRKGGQNS